MSVGRLVGGCKDESAVTTARLEKRWFNNLLMKSNYRSVLLERVIIHTISWDAGEEFYGVVLLMGYFFLSNCNELCRL